MTFDETSFDWQDSRQKAATLVAEALMQLAQQQSDSHHIHL